MYSESVLILENCREKNDAIPKSLMRESVLESYWAWYIESWYREGKFYAQANRKMESNDNDTCACEEGEIIDPYECEEGKIIDANMHNIPGGKGNKRC